MSIREGIENTSQIVGIAGKVIGLGFIVWVLWMGTAGMRMESDLAEVEAQAAAMAAEAQRAQAQQAHEMELARQGWGSQTARQSAEMEAYAQHQAEAERRALQAGATTAEMNARAQEDAEGDLGYAIR